jgi:hypothetical protein
VREDITPRDHSDTRVLEEERVVVHNDMVIDLLLYSVERVLIEHTFIHYIWLFYQSVCWLLELAFVFVEETAHEWLGGLEVDPLSKET